MTDRERRERAALALAQLKALSTGDPLAAGPAVKAPAASQEPVPSEALRRVRGILQRLRRTGCISGRDERLIAALVDQAVDVTVKVEWGDEP